MTTALLERAGIEVNQNEKDVQYDYRTEVSPVVNEGVPRYLIGISTTGSVVPETRTKSESQIDGRIRLFESTETGREHKATVFLEAKVGSAELGNGQLERDADDLQIQTRGEKSRWPVLQWADIYAVFRDHLAESNLSPSSTTHDYLLNEFTNWLRYRDLVQVWVAEHRLEDPDGREHISQLFVGIDGDDELYLRLKGISRGSEKRKESGDVKKLRQFCWQQSLEVLADQSASEEKSRQVEIIAHSSLLPTYGRTRHPTA